RRLRVPRGGLTAGAEVSRGRSRSCRPFRRAFQCPLQIARSPLLDRCALAQLLEPPWYRPVCQVVWEGRSREAPPYPDLWHIAAECACRPTLAPCTRFLSIDSHVCSTLPSDLASRQ